MWHRLTLPHRAFLPAPRRASPLRFIALPAGCVLQYLPSLRWAAKQAELEFNGLDVKEDRGVARMEKLKKETAMLARKVKLIPESC